MQIKANVQPRTYKRGVLKAMFPQKDGKVGLHEFVGTLELAGINLADFALLHAMYKYVFSLSDKAKGTIVVLDNDGKEVLRYYHDEERASAEAKKGNG